jgi:membrane-associated phospholipid phosphatase
VAGSLSALQLPTRQIVATLLGAIAAFVALTLFVGASGDRVPWIDAEVFRWAEAHQSQGLNSFLRFLARLGGTEIVVPAGLAVSALAGLRLRSLSPLGIMGAAYGIAAFVTLQVKHVLERPEPFDGPGDLGLSFPSGHLSQSVSVYLVLYVLADTWPQRKAIRAALVGAEAIIVVAVLYRSAHFLTDVVGGAALGVAAAGAAILAMRTVERLPGARDLLAALRSRPIVQPEELSRA